MNLNRPLNTLPQGPPVLIVGGGIVGAGILRDLSLQGIPSLLIDKKDFSSQTSQNSSKMLHGGIRYLENGDFALVQEALYEKNLWLKLTPHLTYPSRFALPVYRGDLRPLWMVKTGILLYAALSGFRDQHHQALNPDETLLRFPGLKQNHLKGAAIYTDAIVSDAKLTYEVLWDGLIHEKHSYANSYCSLEQLQMDSNGNFQATVKDQLSGESRCLTPKKVVFATGPFTDHLLQKLSVFPWRPQLKLSRGSHIWLKRSRLPLEHPMVITPNDGRVIFLIPQNDRVLVGTTEANQDRPEFDVSPSSIEVNYLLANLNFYFPQAQIEASDILDQFAGMRPLVKSSEGEELGKIARTHKIYRPHENAWVILGGKYTTFRVMASDLTKEICHHFRVPYNPNSTLSYLSKKVTILPFEKPPEFNQSLIESIVESEGVRTLEDLLKRRIGLFDSETLRGGMPISTFKREFKETLKKFQLI